MKNRIIISVLLFVFVLASIIILWPEKTQQLYRSTDLSKVEKENTTETYVDVYGNPKKGKSGYAISKRTFYEDGEWAGKVKDEFYFNASGKPVALSEGQYGRHMEYDEFGRAERITLLDRDGKALYYVRYTFYPDDSVETERYYDKEGNPVKNTEGYFGMRNMTNGHSVSLDENGGAHKSLHLIFSYVPHLVVIVGCALVVASGCISRRLNIVLLGAYVLFIFSMTLMFRAEGDTRANLNLLQSYGQFFYSSKTRIEIINNVWLFVPLGAILFNLKPKRSILLAPVLLTAFIEFIQYFSRRGTFELKDLINNSLGAVIGFGLAFVFDEVKEKVLTRRRIHRTEKFKHKPDA